MLNNEFPPLGGGTGVVNYHLLKFFDTVPWLSVDLVTSSRTRNEFEIERFGERITIHKVPVNNTNIHHASNRELLTYAWRGLSYARKLVQRHQYELSFAFSTVPAAAISYLLRATEELPYLVSLQGPDVPGFEARYNYLYPFLKPVLRRIWDRASVVTAISRDHQQLAHVTMPELLIPIVCNGVDTTAFHPNEKKSVERDINILCVGRLIERKGQDHLLHAFARLRSELDIPLKLTLVGTGDADGRLKRLCAELLLQNSVDFVGVIPSELMPEVYAKGDVFVLPSQNEGMSIALLEAMACGLPVVVTDTGGTAELVRANTNGLIVPWANVDELTKALAVLVRDRELRNRMGTANRRTALKFSWDSMGQAYLDLCTQIAKGSITALSPMNHESGRIVT